MTTSASGADSRARQLLDAQVAYHLDRLSGDELEPTVARVVDDLLTAADRHPITDVVDQQAVKDVVSRIVLTVPASAAVSGFVELATELVYDGPPASYPLGELVDRDRVEVLLDELLALHPMLERSLERLTEAPVVGTVASRFMGRIVGEVLQANKAVAGKVPGLGPLMSLGTGAASKLMGAADKQFEGLLSETVDKGGAFAVRRLNRILIETLQDPTTREALLQVWDLLAAEPVRGIGDVRGQLGGVVDAVHELAVATVASEQVARLGEAVVESFFDRFGGYTVTELLGELDLSRADLVADLVRVAPPLVAALRESGDLERFLRAALEPFYDSDEVRRILQVSDRPVDAPGG